MLGPLRLRRPVRLLFRDDGEKPGRPRWLDRDMGSRWQSPVEVMRSRGRYGERLVDEDHCVGWLSVRGGEWEKNEAVVGVSPSSVLLLTVGAISCSDGKIRSIDLLGSSLNCPAATTLFPFLAVAAAGPVIASRFMSQCHFPTRIQRHWPDLVATAHSIVRWPSRPTPSLALDPPPQPRYPYDRPPCRWWCFPFTSLSDVNIRSQAGGPSRRRQNSART